MIQKYRNIEPRIDRSCFIAPGSVIIGDVIINRNSSVWYQVVIRGDIAPIEIGENTNIQDGCILHCKTGIPLRIGNNITVGHGAILHSCTIEDGCLIGMGAIILDGAKIEKNCLIGAGALVTPKSTFPAGSQVMGNPAVIKRALTSNRISFFQKSAVHYMDLAGEYKQAEFESGEFSNPD